MKAWMKAILFIAAAACLIMLVQQSKGCKQKPLLPDKPMEQSASDDPEYNLYGEIQSFMERQTDYVMNQ